MRAPKQVAIEEEFGEPLFDVIKGFAEMGYGKDTTARILDYDVSSFRKLLKSRGWYEAIPWPALKDQVIMKERGPLPKETRDKIRQTHLGIQKRKREERLAAGWRPVRVRHYHNLEQNNETDTRL